MKKILLIIIMLMLAACTTGGAVNPGQANKLSAAFMEALKNHDYDTALSMVDKDFFIARARDEWVAYFEQVKNVMGERQNLRVKSSINDAKYSGNFYMYEFVSTYENGLGKELLTLVQKINSDDPPRVFAYRFDSSKIPKLNMQ